MIPSAGFFCKSLICFTIAPTAPRDVVHDDDFDVFTPSRFPQTASKTSRWLTNCLSLSLSLSFVVVVVDTNRLEEKDAVQMLFQNAKSSLVRCSFAQERAIIAFVIADVTNNTSFWGRKCCGNKVFLLLVLLLSYGVSIRFFFMLYLGFQMVFLLYSLGKRKFQCCMKKHF